MHYRTKRPVAVDAFACAATMLSGVAHAQRTSASVDGRWTAQSEIIGQTSTGTVVTGGDPKWLAPKPQFSARSGC